MALMATMGWQALGGMQQAMEVNRSHNDAVLTTEAGLNQWTADLDAVLELPQTRSLEWDGRALRLTRRSVQDGDGAIVVALDPRRARGPSPLAALAIWPGADPRGSGKPRGQPQLHGPKVRKAASGANNPRNEPGLRQREVSVVALDALAAVLLPRRRLEQPALQHRRTRQLRHP